MKSLVNSRLESSLRTCIGVCVVAVVAATSALASDVRNPKGPDARQQTAMVKKSVKQPKKKVFVHLLRARSLKKNVRAAMTGQLCAQLAKIKSIEVVCETDVLSMIEMSSTMSGLGGNTNLLAHLEKRAGEVGYLVIPVAKPVKGGYLLVVRLYENSVESAGLAFKEGTQVGEFSIRGEGKVRMATSKLESLPQQLHDALRPVAPPAALDKKK
ncbi:MAG: hypothetical protein GY822_13790 [Deltaproteobacteria bacterium]|nr:hypothetical protein [Deltaproteobacteria bacterium]